MNIIPKKSKSNDLISNKKSYTASKKLWIFILDCLIELFSPQLSSKFPYKQQIAIEAIKDLIVTAQIVSISWYPSMPIHNWDSHSQFWRSLLILNYDNLCNYFGLYSICYVIEFSLLFYAIFVTILCCILKYFCRSLPLIFLHIAKKIINALTSILFIPFLLIPIVVFKYSTFHNNQVQEYSANDISKYDYGSYGTVLSPFVLIILIMMAFINELFTADLKHSESDINIRARSNSLWDLLWILLCIIQCLLYVFMDTHLYIHYLIISLVMNLYLFYLGLKFLHYYKPTGMLIKICKVGTICIVKLFFMLGYAMDDPASLPLLSIFISPLFSIYMIYFVNKKYSKLKRITNCPLNQFAFERAFRHYLIDSKCNNKEEIIRAFCQCSIQNGFKYNALFVIWEVNFISHIVKNQRLARVKLVKTAYLPSNAEGVIQKQKLLKYLEDELSRKWPEIDHLEYLTNCEEVKKLDEEFCIILMDFWAEIIDKTSKISRICNFTNRIFDLSCKIKALYLSLIHKNKHSEVLDLYGMFLINILGENDEGNLILQRKQSIKKIKSGMGDFGKPLEVTEHTGFILISTEPDSFGAISYMNEEAASTLKVSSLDIVGADFGIFIPKPFSLIHKDKMKEFYLNCKTTSIHKPQPLPFLDSTGHIIECMNSIRIVAFNDKAYYMVSFSKFKSSRQSILISEDGFIYSHTAKLSTWIESKISDFQDMHISELSFGIDLRKLKTFEPAIIQLKHKRIALVFIVKTIKETKINNILVLRDQNEIKQWLNKNCEEKNGFCDYDMPSIIEGIEAFATDQNAQLDYFEEKNIMDNSHEESSFDKKYLYQANISSFSQSSTTDRKLYIENANRFINGTIAAIKDFKWILLFTVLFT
ncbi:unnamed protein product [Blepharisma stoltei]|uniref:TmcB/TmcC TPR repeats domain-containing protein n=1 Tax=Blepharisma stoltei TaxID=1481888 RepID=A0AAU9JQ46_9CILI|nr:unnamed protein product [Blepharisma stoltei]